MNWIERLSALARPAALVTVVSAEGSTPRAAGTRMTVTADAVYDTIGGGNLEFKAIELARRHLSDAAAGGVAFYRFPLGPALGQCCGGAVSVAIERIASPAPDWVARLADRLASGIPVVLATPLSDGWRHGRVIERREAGCVADDAIALPVGVRDAAWEMLAKAEGASIKKTAGASRIIPGSDGDLRGGVLLERIAPEPFQIAVFGAGHVGQAIVKVLAGLPCRVRWVDERAAQFPAQIPDNVSTLSVDVPAAEVDALPPGIWFLVMTHSHALDQDICERVLRRGDFAYLGLIGSKIKRAQFERRLAERGLSPLQLARLTCPIGLASIRGKEPGVIAVAVAAQLLELRFQLRQTAAAALALPQA